MGTGERTAATAANGKQHEDPRLLDALSHENKHNPGLSATAPSLNFHPLSAQGVCEGVARSGRGASNQQPASYNSSPPKKGWIYSCPGPILNYFVGKNWIVCWLHRCRLLVLLFAVINVPEYNRMSPAHKNISPDII